QLLQYFRRQFLLDDSARFVPVGIWKRFRNVQSPGREQPVSGNPQYRSHRVINSSCISSYTDLYAGASREQDSDSVFLPGRVRGAFRLADVLFEVSRFKSVCEESHYDLRLRAST